MKYFFIYAILGISGCFFNFFFIFFIYRGSYRMSNNIHKDMVESLVNAPIPTYHDTIPKGRIFNILSKDLDNIDLDLIVSLREICINGSSIITSIVICAIYQPYCLCLIPFIFFIGYKISKFYSNCSRDINRIEGILRTPVMNTINETIPGSITIRAYGFENKYKNIFNDRNTEQFKINFIINGINNWFNTVLESLSFSFIVFLIIFTIIFKKSFSPQMIGLLLTYSVSLQNSLIKGIEMFAKFDNAMVSVERCIVYTKCPSEKQKHMEIDKNLENWPNEGKIEFHDFSVRYRPDTEIVLKHLNLKINKNEKIGIVGRSGSGKSTISLCLFRLLDNAEGKIIIDDIDISTIGLSKLRTSITIIPQDPSLFLGTLRYNIDPLNKYTNESIIEIMKELNFYNIVEQNKDGLLQFIEENGANLSVGQKQLICIVRAVLRKSKIIIMDEATANVDYKSETIIQNAIKNLFKDSTVITIAHRIKTIIDYDKVLVLDSGEIKEFDDPKILQQNKDGIFYQLVQKSKI